MSWVDAYIVASVWLAAGAIVLRDTFWMCVTAAVLHAGIAVWIAK